MRIGDEVFETHTSFYDKVFDLLQQLPLRNWGGVMKKIDLTNFEGTADQLGEQVFKQLIAPMLDEMKSQDTD